MAISSLPSKYGIGCFSKEAYQFVDWLKEAGQRYWQILPMGPTGYGDSPYQSFSTFAGNPYFIDLEALIYQGLLTEEECDRVDFGCDGCEIDYKKLYEGRFELLRRATSRVNLDEEQDYQNFLEENREWLFDYSLFMALKDFFGGMAWYEWEEGIRLRNSEAMEYYRKALQRECSCYQYLQYLFFRQWQALRTYANDRDIEIIGDIPIYVARDSADVWAHPELFSLDERRLPRAVAGCPPDGFSPDGQLWGNPLYDWEYHKKTSFAWWILRITWCFEIYDALRIDHFRGFDEYYTIPYGEETAVNGHWEKGPGILLFQALQRALGPRKIIAEDLGFVTDSVRRLVRDCGYPGMKVFEFAFDQREQGTNAEYLPHNYDRHTVAYTGTHDNETLSGWWMHMGEQVQAKVRQYACDAYTPDDEMYLPLIGLVMRSASDLVIIPLQDYLGLGNEARMNHPSTVGTNWKWRVAPEDLSKELAEMIKNITKGTDR